MGRMIMNLMKRRLFLIFIIHMIFDREESSKRNWRNELNLTCKLAALDALETVSDEQQDSADVLLNENDEVREFDDFPFDDSADLSDKDYIGQIAHQLAIVMKDVAKAEDVLQRKEIGQTSCIVLLIAEVRYLDQEEHAKHIIWIDWIKSELLTNL